MGTGPNTGRLYSMGRLFSWSELVVVAPSEPAFVDVDMTTQGLRDEEEKAEEQITDKRKC